MNALINTLPPSRFAILAFPCNQFGHQEQGKNASEILNGLKYVRPGGGFEPHPDMVMFKRCDVNGPEREPVYKYLTESCVAPTSNAFKLRESFWDPIRSDDVSWNFEKFLVSPSGVPIFRFHPRVEPWDIEDIITLLLDDVTDFRAQRAQLDELLQQVDTVVTKRMFG